MNSPNFKTKIRKTWVLGDIERLCIAFGHAQTDSSWIQFFHPIKWMDNKRGKTPLLDLINKLYWTQLHRVVRPIRQNGYC